MHGNSDRPQPSADELIALLMLEPHPEGGFFRETFRDACSIEQDDRAASTAIYFLLKAGEVSRWHKVDAAEVWHWYAGSPLELGIAEPSGRAPAERVCLGNDILSGQHPQAVVPAGYWQQARSLGEYTLVGCTVAPGFMFQTFELAPAGFEPGSSDS